MAEKAVTIRTRKQFIIDVLHPGRANVSKLVMRSTRCLFGRVTVVVAVVVAAAITFLSSTLGKAT
ncbi:hypothetical protein Lal_00000104, partial [Lupinus albus]